MKPYVNLLLMMSGFLLVQACSHSDQTSQLLQEWQLGVWVSDSGGYSIWTPTHYFVVSAAGDSSKANIYCGSSRVVYTDHGVARAQNLRVRQTQGSPLKIIADYSMYDEGPHGGMVEEPLNVDMAQFQPGTCNIVGGVIYDSVTEKTPEYILLSSCNGDQVKLFSDGRSLYISANGNESWSYRIESF